MSLTLVRVPEASKTMVEMLGSSSWMTLFPTNKVRNYPPGHPDQFRTFVRFVTRTQVSGYVRGVWTVQESLYPWRTRILGCGIESELVRVVPRTNVVRDRYRISCGSVLQSKTKFSCIQVIFLTYSACYSWFNAELMRFITWMKTIWKKLKKWI